MTVLPFNFLVLFAILSLALPSTVSTWPHAVTLWSVIENTQHGTLFSVHTHPSRLLERRSAAHLHFADSPLAESG